ncbi:hypothetical protein AC629_06565 [Bradyrhizobium sp. NAS80.1]|uniref:BTAD domain-containing putative transcriptional regulator n=1 Tax=Bradyrhizobium sp. NAS80.1 TaxID=1680159 RepID=UPI0009651C65|nr:BTAD domain-containing putative transcriptional regulator [Bradyrhizobium sp. NAS80.1]OKO89352.1 hypothetical protein AC629_06565 [Bradyrhizobium sp. NAS80.1]
MAEATSPRFCISLLGRLELTGPEGLVDLPSKKLAGLLAYLACTAPRPQPRDRLASLLWGSHFDTQAKQNLRQALFRLRKLLGEDALASDGELVSLNGAVVHCDVGRFEALIREGSRDALSAAADLYRGPLVDDVAVSEEGWCEWLTAERERLLQLALGAMVGLGEQELAAGRAEHALRAGQRAVALNNIREDAHRLIVRALAAEGRKAEALKHYQALVTLLKQELSAAPDAVTRSLVAELRSAQPPVKEAAERGLDSNGSTKDALNTGRPAARADESSSVLPAGSADPERRQLTIMACTIVGSPDAASPDPEDLRNRIGAFRKAVADVAARFDGFVAQYLIDGVLVYFGYPTAHEHDAERAVRAGLALMDAVGALKGDVPLQASAGIASGLVVVGEQAATAGTRQHIAVGEAPNLAAQLQAVAAPGGVVIAASTRRLVGRMFDFHALGANERKRLPPSVEAWQVRGETPGISRFEARRAGVLSSLVGRWEEMERLMLRWDQAKAGEGQVVLLSGEPGIGKSRIAESLLMKLEGDPQVIRYFCSPHHTHSPLYPIMTRLERAASFEPGSSASAKLDKLEALLKPIATNFSRDVALIAELLGVPADERYPPATASPQQKREMTLAALLDQLDRAAAEKPILIVFEDVHWIDPTSLDLLDRMVARIANLPVMLVVTFRPEFQPASIGEPHVTMLPLSRLGRRDSAGIIDGVTKGRTLPETVVEQVLARADGVPLFIEELISTLLESGLLREDSDRYVLDRALPPLAIPTTLHASLLARLDRLGSARLVAQIGSAIGREFPYTLLHAVSRLPEDELQDALAHLVASELVVRRGTPLDAVYTFKHALVRDAAYGTLLRNSRQQLHGQIAEAIGRLRPEAAEREPELLAWHCTWAGQAGPAVGHWRRAGEQSIARYANREAIGHFERALEQLGMLAPGEERDRLEADLRLAQAVPIIAVHGYGAQAVELCASRAKELGQHLPGWAGQFAVRRLAWNSHMLRHPMPRTISLARDLLSFAERSDDPVQTAIACRALGFSLLFAGELVEANPLLARGAIHADGVAATDFAAYGENPSILCRLGGGWVSSLMGSRDTALRMIGEGLARARASGNPHPISWALGILALVHKLRGDAPSTKRAAAEAVEVAGEHNLPQWRGFAELWLGWALGRLGEREEGLALLQVAQRRLRDTGAVLFTVMSNWVLAEAGVLAGRPETALEHLAAAQEHAERFDEGFMLAEIHRLHATALCALNAPASEREGRLRRALGIAQRQGARTWELRAAMDLARLWRDQGKRETARDLLVPVYGRFTEGFDTLDVKQAKALLDELAL